MELGLRSDHKSSGVKQNQDASLRPKRNNRETHDFETLCYTGKCGLFKNLLAKGTFGPPKAFAIII